jgi:glycine/D-amino acid oxidase-like deaminating enzyme
VEVAVIGGGIVGCAAAALLAEAGARVTLHERAEVAAGASGRNQGVLQHPLDAILAPLYEESLQLHAETAPELDLGRPPDGLLLVSRDPALTEECARRIASSHPALGASFLEDAREAEPGLAPGVSACRLDTGHQIPPAAATHAWAARARRAGAVFRVGREVVPADVSGDVVLVAAGPWTSALCPVPVLGVWGVTVQVRLEAPPAHALEEAVIEELATMSGHGRPAFAAVTADGVTTLGATFLADEPDAAPTAAAVVEHAASILPAAGRAERLGTRACARPVSPDGYPLIGRALAGGRAWVATGNGPWGMTCGPATARIAVDALLGRAPVPAALDVDRLGRAGG